MIENLKTSSVLYQIATKTIINNCDNISVTQLYCTIVLSSSYTSMSILYLTMHYLAIVWI